MRLLRQPEIARITGSAVATSARNVGEWRVSGDGQGADDLYGCPPNRRVLLYRFLQ